MELALTHRSVGGKNNERLEFLGDRVLGLIIADMLFETFPHEPEGDLGYRFTALARRESLARVAQEIEDVVGLDAADVLPVSAKSGVGMEDLLQAIVDRISPPVGDPELPTRALIFDSWFDPYVGVVMLVRVMDGQLGHRDAIRLMMEGSEHEMSTRESWRAYTPASPSVAGKAQRGHANGFSQPRWCLWLAEKAQMSQSRIVGLAADPNAITAF